MTRTDEAERLEARIAELRAGMSGMSEREAAGELSDTGQHQADGASELEDRERTLGIVEQLERRLHRLRTGEDPDDTRAPVPGADADDDGDPVTPLDLAEPREDLSAIPMATGAAPDDPDLVADPQEATGEPDIDMPGALYPHEGGAPAVGRPEPDDAVLEDYRPD